MTDEATSVLEVLEADTGASQNMNNLIVINEYGKNLISREDRRR